MATTNNPLLSANAKLLDVLHEMGEFRKPTIVILHSASIAEAWKILAQHHLLSAPMDKESGGYYGFIDMFDIISFMIGQCIGSENEGQPEKFARHVLWRDWCCDRGELVTHCGGLVNSIPAISIVNCSGTNPFVCLSVQAHVSELLTKLKEGIHRVMLVDDEGCYKGIITQFDIIRLLEPCLQREGKDLASKTLAELGLDSQGTGICTVNILARTIYAFQKMAENHVSAIAVVDDDGIIQGNMSVSDLRGLAASDLGTLLMPVQEFLKEKIKQGPPAVCSSDHTLGTVVKKLLDNHFHRLWCTVRFSEETPCWCDSYSQVCL